MLTFGGLAMAGKIWESMLFTGVFQKEPDSISKSLLLGVIASEAKRFVYLLAMP